MFVSALLLIAARLSPSTCEISPPIPDPRPGFEIIFENGTPHRFGQRIGSTRLGATEFKEYALVEDMRTGRATRVDSRAKYAAVRGIFPVLNEGGGAKVARTFHSDSARILEGMSVGETRRLSSTETVTTGDDSQSLNDEIEISFLGCGAESIAGAALSVAKYSITTRSIDVRNMKRRKPIETVTEFWIAPTLGWWVYGRIGDSVVRASSIRP